MRSPPKSPGPSSARELIGRAGSSSSSMPGKITFLCPQWLSGVAPTWVHSKPRKATMSGSAGPPASSLHWRTFSFSSSQCSGVSASAWSVSAKKSRAAQ